MPKQPMTRAQECVREVKRRVTIVYPRGKTRTRALAEVRRHIAKEIAEAETRGMMFGAAVMAGALVNGLGETRAAKEGLIQFGKSPADWAGLGLTNYDMRAVRQAFREG